MDYTINGQKDPELTLERGVTYVFRLTGIERTHPFWIVTHDDFFTSVPERAYTNSVINNGSSSGDLIFTVPTNAPNRLYYQCSVHGGMFGVLNIVDPPMPPTVRIVEISVGREIVLKSTGASGWRATEPPVAARANFGDCLAPSEATGSRNVLRGGGARLARMTLRFTTDASFRASADTWACRLAEAVLPLPQFSYALNDAKSAVRVVAKPRRNFLLGIFRLAHPHRSCPGHSNAHRQQCPLEIR